MSEIPLFPWWLTLALAIWAALGPVIGILIAHYLLRSWQRRQWLADNRKEEYRKLLAALNRVNMALVNLHCFQIANEKELDEATKEITVATNTSLFINDFLRKSQVLGMVLEAVKKLGKGGKFDDYTDEYWRAVNMTLDSAKRTMF